MRRLIVLLLFLLLLPPRAFAGGVEFSAFAGPVWTEVERSPLASCACDRLVLTRQKDEWQADVLGGFGVSVPLGDTPLRWTSRAGLLFDAGHPMATTLLELRFTGSSAESRETRVYDRSRERVPERRYERRTTRRAQSARERPCKPCKERR